MTAVLPRARPRVHAALGDAELMALLQAGVAAAFVVLYHRHARTVFSLAHRIVGDRAVAEDVTQDAFIGLWQHRHHYAPERGAARTWLLAIARHRAIDLTRRRSRRAEPLDGAHAEREAPERTDEEVLRRSEATALGEAVRG